MTEADDIYAIQSIESVILEDVTITNNNNPLNSMSFTQVSVSIKSMSLINKLGDRSDFFDYGGAISCIECISFNLSNAYIKNVRANKGGAIYLSLSETEKKTATSILFMLSNVTIENSTSTGTDGGILYLDNI